MWHVEFNPENSRLTVRLRDHVSPEQLRELAVAHSAALEHTGGHGFQVFLDLRGLFPLDARAVAILAEIKRVAAEASGCRGFVILADSPTVAMQQQRTRVRPGSSSDAELITLEPAEAEREMGGLF